MTEFLNELSENQINYLKQQKKHKYIVGISRILILFSFLFLWEFTANVGIIDSFIFSSPSKIALCFWGMVLDKSIFLHTNVTLYETILSFLLVTATSILVTILLWFSRRCGCRSSWRWLRQLQPAEPTGKRPESAPLLST